ncbi:HNH endonuclease [Rahnella variigena]|uniref:HNH endonuclease n=1 Tax=Rahnella variigena TaxID=574964 RepID=UPI003D297359
MDKCIICRKDKDNMSDEHVIPDSIGGYYHIYNVCRDCNSHLGTKVDALLINDKITQFYRNAKSIKGKKGHIPNPLSDIFTDVSDSRQKMTFKRSTDNELLPYIIQSNEVIRNDEGVIEKITISLDEGEAKKVEVELDKILRRNKLTREQIAGVTVEKRVVSSSFKTTWSLNLNSIKLSILKIAYEYAVDKIPGYIDDPSALKISQILFDADIEKAAKFVNVGSGLDNNILEPFESFIDFDKNRHFLILTDNKKSLFCLVMLKDTFAFGISLSKRKYIKFEESLIGVNDVDNKSFETHKMIDVLSENQGNVELEFFNGNESLKDIEPDFKAYAHEVNRLLQINERDYIPLYDCSRTCVSYLHEVLDFTGRDGHALDKITSIGSVSRLKIRNHTQELYVKSANTMKFHKVTCVSMTQTWKKRL